MKFTGLFLVAVALAMDAFAVSICKGFSIKKMSIGKMITVGLYFSIFQALMPLIGYFLADLFNEQIQEYDHWVAFLLLIGLGIKMLIEAMSKDQSCPSENSGSVRFLVMLPLAIATSLDALAAGITFRFLNVDMLLATLLIGVVTFVICSIGVKLGSVFGMKYQRKAEFAGGIILILLGIKILLEHLEIL